MSAKKDLKRATQEVWARLKALRKERAKLYSAAELEASAAELAQCASDLKLVAKQASALAEAPAGATITRIKKSKKEPTPGEA